MFSIQELRTSTKKELMLELDKSRKEMLKTRISLKTRHEKDTSKAKKTKKYIARILTVLKEVKEDDNKEEKPASSKGGSVSGGKKSAKKTDKK